MNSRADDLQPNQLVQVYVITFVLCGDLDIFYKVLHIDMVV